MHPEVTPCNDVASSKTNTLHSTSYDEIVAVLGKPNIADDFYKVEHSWGFTYKGHKMAIWDWKGSWLSGQWSTYGPTELIRELFPNKDVRW